MKAFFTGLAIFVYLLSPVLAVQEEPVNEQAEEQPFGAAARLADLEEDPHAVVHNVNVITGDYTEVCIDMSLGGEALQLMRSYCSSERRKPRHGTPFGFWEFNHRGYLANQSDGAYHNYEFQDENGRHVLFRRFKKDGQGYPFRLYPYLFQFDQGYTHFPSPRTCAPHPLSARLYCHKHRRDHLVVTGCGDRYTFKDESHSIGKEKGQLIHQIQRLSGFCLSYHYDEHGNVTLVDLLNRNQEIVQSLTFIRGEEKNCLTVKASDGRSVTYCKKAKIGEPCLEVSPSFAPAVTYVYNSKTGKLARCEGPDGRYLQIDYYQTGEERIVGEKFLIGGSDPRRGRVKRLVEPLGPGGKPIATHRFVYEVHKDGSGATHVYDAEGHLIVYHYGNDKRISAIEHYDEAEKLYSRESFYWTIDGELRSRTFEDSSGTILYCKNYSYDDRGNLSCERLYGDLTGNNTITPELTKRGIPKHNGCEVSRKNYHYSNRGNLLTEEWDERSRIRYVYHEESNLLAAKYQYEGRTISRRWFYEYDKNGALTLEITDDGNRENRKDLTKVTERHIRRTLNRFRAPAGLPKIVEESVLDLATGQEILIHVKKYSYDSCGRLVKLKQVDGENERIHAWEFDSFGNVTKETDALGQVTLRQYDLSGKLIREEGPDPAMARIFAYDAINRLIREETLGTQIVKSWAYDKCGRKISSTDEYGYKTRYIYDIFGRLLETHLPVEIGADGQKVKPVESRYYNVMGQLISLIQADGGVIHSKSNVRGQPVDVQYPDGTRERHQYSRDGLLLRKVSKVGVAKAYAYDYLGRWTQEDIFDSNGLLAQTTTRTYQGNHLVSQTDPAGHLISYHYDYSGHLIRIEEGERVTHYERDLSGRLSATRLAGSVKRQVYDALNRIIEELEENEQGQLQRRTRYGYDAAGRRFQVTQGQNSVTTLFNVNGDPTSVIDAQGNQTHTLYRYDYGNQQGERVAYSETIDPDGRKTVSIRDVWGRIASMELYDPLGTHVQTKSYAYDIQGRKTIQNIAGQVILWQFNSAGQLIRMVESAGTSQQKSTGYTYSSGLLESVTKPDGVVLHYQYDSLGRLERLSSSDGTLHESYLYDVLGNLCQAEDHVHGVKTSKVYDRFGNCVQECLGNNLSLSSSFDAMNRPIVLTLPDQSNVTYTYSGSQLTAVNRAEYAHHYSAYDENGHSTEAQLIGKAGFLQLSRDSEGRPLAIKSSCWEASYHYDSTGHLIQRQLTDSEGSHDATYSYDALGQLTKDGDHTYACDARYNLKGRDGRSFVIDGLNQLLDDGERQYVYDLAGRLIKRQFDGRYQEYAYDALDRLTEVIEGKTRYRYLYDHEGRRLSKTIASQLASGKWKVNKQITYLYYGHSEIGSFEGTQMRELRILGTGLGAEIGATVAIELDGYPYAPIHDNNGNIVCLIDSNGHEAWTARYTSFGESSAKGVDNPWIYASKRLDQETGWIYFGRRFYDPYSARWTTPDPIGYKGGPNLYAYVLNNPLTHFDPEGMFLESISAFIYDSCYLLGNTLSLIGDHFLPVPYLREALSYTGRFFSGGRAYPTVYSRNADLGIPEINSKVRVISVNGMMTCLDDARAWAQNISSCFGDGNVHYSYNSSHGFMLDLLECIAQKLGFHTHCEEKLVQMIREQCGAVGDGGEVHLIAHSQGGQVLSNALSHLSPLERKMLHIATFGSAKMIGHEDLGDAVNFINRGDIIPWIADPFGILRHSSTIEILSSNLLEHSVFATAYQNALRRQGGDIYEIYGRL
ncbi:MAG: hypothetical protein LLG04_17905 [Parachlamydia sp.]|nr:hypothetical protein [Parachlamydia sp.]